MEADIVEMICNVPYLRHEWWHNAFRPNRMYIDSNRDSATRPKHIVASDLCNKVKFEVSAVIVPIFR